MRVLARVLVGLGAAALLWASVCLVPQPDVSWKLHREFDALPLPQGGEAQYREVRATPLVAYDGTDYASTLVHYRDRNATALAEEAGALLADAGWRIQGSGAYRSGSRDDGWRVNVETGRWKEDGRGCCVATTDPARPVGLLLHLFPG